ncbi:MAG: zinc carboxypeptidase [Chitinophagaceae bacterium]|nr:zinc carboxypeptidase [Chitinophagaceae bacterium]
MLKFKFIAVLLFLTSMSVFAQSIPSPDEFLGYPLGSKFTYHHRIVQYFETLAKAKPNEMKLQAYGQTNERRPLMVAFVSTPENIAKLESIRQNNLKLTKADGNSIAVSASTPAIVWLSYNVHGNESSSSEAVMKTIYTLLDPNNVAARQWLKNVVVVIDPCINPDGRDRYANWYNSIASLLPNTDPQARDHQEPWPGGRSNHYNFDLNRDWAWQTQVETQQRLKLYNQWMPQVHVDFHEQGVNEPYYFAPAAEPYHDVITPWQRDFQNIIGRNHAKYFDANNWLFFTKERFDLFYPSYGDTYPIYNGSIGMTFEQGGGGRAGLAIVNSDGDTLTLKDRLTHHFTTGMSTIEMASLHAEKLVKAFQQFFADGTVNGSGEFKSYLVRLNPAKPEQHQQLKAFLQSHGISFGYANATKPVKMYNYLTGAEEIKNVQINDLVISTYQPKAKLIHVLFEPKSRISDSATYDITAWSIPYAWGLETYAAREKITGSTFTETKTINNTVANNSIPIGYIIPWNGFNSAKLLSQLLQKGIKVRYTSLPFQIGGQTFERGSLMVLKTSNASFADSLLNITEKAAAKAGVLASITPVYTGFVDKGLDFGGSSVNMINKPRVAMLTGEGVSSIAAGEIWHYFEQQLQYPITLINQATAANINWEKYSVVIMPDGNYKFLNDKPAQEHFKNWIQQGGKLIAIESAVELMAKMEWGITKKKADNEDEVGYKRLHQYEQRERDDIQYGIPGAVFKLSLDNTHPLAFGYPTHYFTLKMDDYMYDFLDKGWNVGVMKKESYVSGFVGSKTKQLLQDGLLLGVYPMGKGNIVYMADDPIFRSFWENGKLLLANAIFLVD